MTFTETQVREALKEAFFQKGEFWFPHDEPEESFNKLIADQFIKNLREIAENALELAIGDIVEVTRGDKAGHLGKVIWVSKAGRQVGVEFQTGVASFSRTMRTAILRKAQQTGN